ncbi:unnamed protein product [Gulo gulo]|uniref:Uncharacterized protein n=1 Tax=Gulo gulo TaxID=48420 RepID=A0A9X9LFA6_GULGU|nr:unnamed protein product [Gulo gulo]
MPLPSTGDSWGLLACLCTVLWHLPAVPALNRTGDPGPGPSIQKTYDLTRYLEHQLRSLAGTYPRCRALLPSELSLALHSSGPPSTSAAWPPVSSWLLFLSALPRGGPAPEALHTQPISTPSLSSSCKVFSFSTSSWESSSPPLPQLSPPRK